MPNSPEVYKNLYKSARRGQRVQTLVAAVCLAMFCVSISMYKDEKDKNVTISEITQQITTQTDGLREAVTDVLQQGRASDQDMREQLVHIMESNAEETRNLRCDVLLINSDVGIYRKYIDGTQMTCEERNKVMREHLRGRQGE